MFSSLTEQLYTETNIPRTTISFLLTCWCGEQSLKLYGPFLKHQNIPSSTGYRQRETVLTAISDYYDQAVVYVESTLAEHSLLASA